MIRDFLFILQKEFRLLTYVESNKTPLKKFWGYFLPVVFTFIFLYLAFKGIDLAKSFDIIFQISLIWLLVYVCIFMISHLLRALRWKLMIKPVKRDVSLLNLFGAVMIGYGVNCIIPRLGEVYRGFFLGKWENVSRATMLGTVIVERIIDISAFAFASLLSVYLFPGNLFKEILWLKTSLIIGFALIFLITVFLIFLVRFEAKFNTVIIRIVGKFSKKASETLSEILSTLVSGFSIIESTKAICNIVILTVMILLVYALNAYIGFYMLGMQNSGNVNFLMAWIFMTISAYGVIVPTPGGTGSYHIISILVLTQLYNYDYEVSAAYALLTHFISYVIFIGSTFGVVYIINRLRVKKGENKENFFSVFTIRTER